MLPQEDCARRSSESSQHQNLVLPAEARARHSARQTVASSGRACSPAGHAARILRRDTGSRRQRLALSPGADILLYWGRSPDGRSGENKTCGGETAYRAPLAENLNHCVPPSAWLDTCASLVSVGTCPLRWTSRNVSAEKMPLSSALPTSIDTVSSLDSPGSSCIGSLLPRTVQPHDVGAPRMRTG